MRIIKDYETELKLVEDYIKTLPVPGQVMQILEAGCGREWYFNLNGVEYEITGVDLDEEALRARRRDKGDLKRTIVGDLRTLELSSNSFDVIYNAFVLEHVRGAERVLENFAAWLRPGGLLIIRVPDLKSVQAFLGARIPHWSKVMYYKYAWGIKNAGEPGFAPYPVVYDPVISQSGLRDFCDRHGLVIREEIGVGSYAARGRGPLRVATAIIARLVHWLSLGRIHDRYVDVTLVAQKPTSHSSQPETRTV